MVWAWLCFAGSMLKRFSNSNGDGLLNGLSISGSNMIRCQFNYNLLRHMVLKKFHVIFLLAM